jgi:hypothetical protein
MPGVVIAGRVPVREEDVEVMVEEVVSQVP